MKFTTMKKILAMVIVIIMMFSMIPVHSHATDDMKETQATALAETSARSKYPDAPEIPEYGREAPETSDISVVAIIGVTAGAVLVMLIAKSKRKIVR